MLHPHQESNLRNSFLEITPRLNDGLLRVVLARNICKNLIA